MSYWKNIKTVCADLSPNCRSAARTQSEMLDHPLTWSRRLGLWLHVLICRWCRRYGRQLRYLRSVAQTQGEAPASAPPPKLSAAARERIRQRLQKEQ